MKSLFGTDGIRAKMGDYPLTSEGLNTLGTQLGGWIYNQNKTRIIIATDTRSSANFCKYSLISGLIKSPLNIEDAGILPTPVLHYLVQNYDYDYGIIITASHNDASYNGIKIVTKNGKLSQTEQYAIENFPTSNTLSENHLTWANVVYNPDAFKTYAQDLNNFFTPNFLDSITIVIDCAYGAWSYYAESLFKQFGANVISISSSGFTNLINEKCGSMHPHKLQQATLLHKARIGFAFDGDGDRVVVVNQKGEIKNGDDILALLMHHPTYKTNETIVGTIMTNEGLSEYIEEYSKKLLRTKVGDCHIVQALKKENSTLGGEPSGHIITRDFSESSDGLFTALRLLEIIILHDNFELNSFSKYPQEIINMPVTLQKDLETETFQAFINEHKKILEKSRIMIRYSGTEPVVRILVEYNNHEDQELVKTKVLPSLTQYFA